MILEHKGIPIFYTDKGQGSVTVFLHGFLENAFMWQSISAQIPTSQRVITIDLLGHGQTGCLGYVHTMELMAEAINAVLNHLNIDKLKFVGHSMGGYVALAYAELCPEHVTGLCLMNSTAQADSEDRKTNRDRAIAAVKQNYKAFISMSIANLFSDDNRPRMVQEIADTKEQALKTPLQGIVAALEGMKIRKDRSYILQDSSFKKMIIVGRRDPVLDYESVLEQIKGTDIELIEFEDGHMSHLENKEESTYKIIQFIEK